MNILDIVLVLIMLYCLWQGYNSGLLLGLVSLAVVVLALVAAVIFQPPLGESLSSLAEDYSWVAFISFYIIFVAVIWILGAIVGAVAKRLSQAGNKSGRLAGVIAGLARGVLICAVLVMTCGHFLPHQPYVNASTLSPYLAPLTRVMEAHMPDDESLSEARDFLQDKARAWGDAVKNTTTETGQRVKNYLDESK